VSKDILLPIKILICQKKKDKKLKKTKPNKKKRKSASSSSKDDTDEENEKSDSELITDDDIDAALKELNLTFIEWNHEKPTWSKAALDVPTFLFWCIQQSISQIQWYYQHKILKKTDLPRRNWQTYP